MGSEGRIQRLTLKSRHFGPSNTLVLAYKSVEQLTIRANTARSLHDSLRSISRSKVSVNATAFSAIPQRVNLLSTHSKQNNARNENSNFGSWKTAAARRGSAGSLFVARE